MLITTAHDPTGDAEKLGGTKSRISPCLPPGWRKSLRWDHTLLHRPVTQAAQILLAQSSVSLAFHSDVATCGTVLRVTEHTSQSY